MITAVNGSEALNTPLLAPVLLPLAALVAALRVRLRVHHVGDVLVGDGLGLTGAISATLLAWQS